MTLLTVTELEAWYGRTKILERLALEVETGHILTLLGRNGVGKTTLALSVAGIGPRVRGSVRLHGRELLGRSPEDIARAGVALVPQGRGIFSSLTVEENLDIVHATRPGRWDRSAVYELFPRLEARRRVRGNRISGGEQQMLAIARALLLNPDLLILDEPTEGLAPAFLSEVAEIVRLVASEGTGAVLVEQAVGFALDLADTVAIVDRGRIISSGPRSSVTEEDVASMLLGDLAGQDTPHDSQEG